jgi:hypothetical protein
MEQVDGAAVAEMVEDLIHRETQVEDDAVVLTVDSVHRIDTPAELDFGGSEYQAAGTTLVEPVKRSDDDSYGWWELDDGQYRITYNESLALEQGCTGLLQPWWKLFMNGVDHPTQALSGEHDELHMLLEVEQPGIKLKENARVTELRVFR